MSTPADSDDPNEINEDNCRLLLAAFMEESDVTAPRVCRAVGCSTASLARILAFVSLPTAEFMKQTGIMIGIGMEKYEKPRRPRKSTFQR